MVSRVIAEGALSKFEEDLLRNENVAFISVVSGVMHLDIDDNDNYHVQVGVYDIDKQISLAADEIKDFSMAVPSFLSLDTEHEVPVEIVETDEIIALGFRDRVRPAGGGNSSSISNLGGSGTLGAKITVDGKEGFYLTNWHVAHGGKGAKGSKQVQPGQGDGGKLPKDDIGGLHWWALNQYLDAAVVKTENSLLSYKIRCWGTGITGSKTATNGMSVKKCGRTSGATTGRIVSTSATIRVSGYPGGVRVFRDQIQMTPMQRPGDSGSVLLSSDNKAVGLCFAGSTSQSFANKFSRLQAQAEKKDQLIEKSSNMSDNSIAIGFKESD